ncbi:MAG TPA: hypothetical protein VFJ87_05935 [Rhodanobacteraceae bacterium]|nr:hypothetical protein [Rhodanobacteraceae bacterium]
MTKRRGRGVDFNHRFATSRWAEDLLAMALNTHPTGLCCTRLGLSQISEDGDPLDDDTDVKEPDLLVFERAVLTSADFDLLAHTDLTTLRASQIQSDAALMKILRKACAAIEVEFSPYQAAEMNGRNWKPRTQADFDRRAYKHANPPVAPNIWVKLEDLPRLQRWQQRFGVPIAIAHLFDQEAFAVDLRTIVDFEDSFPSDPQVQRELQLRSGIFRKLQSYDRVDAQGAGEKKIVFVVTPSAALKVGDITGVNVSAQLGLSRSKKYVAQIIFEDGKFSLDQAFIAHLRQMRGDVRN